MIGGMSTSPNHVAMAMCCRPKWIASPPAITTASPESTTSGATPPTGPVTPISTATSVPANAGRMAKK